MVFAARHRIIEHIRDIMRGYGSLSTPSLR
jgi:hypothetical protein